MLKRPALLVRNIIIGGMSALLAHRRQEEVSSLAGMEAAKPLCEWGNE